MSAVIILHPGPMQSALADFVTDSALIYCTRVEIGEYDALDVVAVRDPGSFSSGERLLWSLLQSMTTGDLAEAADRLDRRNAAAVARVVDTLMGRHIQAVTS